MAQTNRPWAEAITQTRGFWALPPNLCLLAEPESDDALTTIEWRPIASLQEIRNACTCSLRDTFKNDHSTIIRDRKQTKTKDNPNVHQWRNGSIGYGMSVWRHAMQWIKMKQTSKLWMNLINRIKTKRSETLKWMHCGFCCKSRNGKWD